jgi:ATP-dependent RNA helicase DHX36
MKKQFCGLLYDTGFISSSYPDNEIANYNSQNMKLVKAVLCAGLYPNVVKIEQNRPGR